MSNSINKTVSPSLKYFPNVMMTENISFPFLWIWFIILVLLLYIFPPIIDIDVKHVFPNSAFFWYFFFSINYTLSIVFNTMVLIIVYFLRFSTFRPFIFTRNNPSVSRILGFQPFFCFLSLNWGNVMTILYEYHCNTSVLILKFLFSCNQIIHF